MFTSSDRRSVYKTALRPTQVKSARVAIEKSVVDAAEWFLADLEQKLDDKNGVWALFPSEGNGLHNAAQLDPGAAHLDWLVKV